MSTFAVTNSDPQTLMDGLNYAISNLGQVGNVSVGNALVANTTSGEITTPDGQLYGWLYQYIYVAYADSATGSGFTRDRTGKTWFGQLNSTFQDPNLVTNYNNPSAYIWTESSTPFSSTVGLWYSTIGGGKILYRVSDTQPTIDYIELANNYLFSINLGEITAGATSSNTLYTATIYQRSATQPDTPPTGFGGGSYDFTTTTLTPPTGWEVSVPVGTDPVYTSINTFSSQNSGSEPMGPWTTPAVSFENGEPGQDGASSYQVTAYARKTTQPATPNGGSWNFSTASGVAPTGGDGTVWTLTPPTGNIQLWGSYTTATVIGSTGTDSTLSWSTPSELSSAGATGPQGPRGFIPLAYVVTDSNPLAYTSSQFTAAFSASRGNVVAPIGAGYPPIAGDTAQFIWSAGNGTPNTVQTYNGTTWSSAIGQVIGGNLIVTGTVTANKLAANDIYAINLQSTNANLGNINSAGYWLQANTGNARFGGNVWIGSSLTVGNLITSGTLNANTVTATQIAASAVGITALQANSVTPAAIANSAITLGKIANGAVGVGTIATGAVITGAIAANAVVAGTIATGAVTAGVIAANAVTTSTIAANAVTTDKVAANSITANQISTSYVYAGNIYGNQIVANTITSTQISSNYIYAGNIISTGATLGNINSPGYWMEYTSGNARFGGNVWIGNNLTVGNLITSSGLNTGVVLANNIANGVLPISASGNITSTSSVTLSTPATYSQYYSTFTLYSADPGFTKTIAYIQIPVTSAMATATASNPVKYNLTFSCNVSANMPGIVAGGGGSFNFFSNDQYYGGNGVTVFYPANSVPSVTGSTSRGSIATLSKRIGTGAAGVFTTTIQSGATFSFPYSSAYTLTAGSYVTIGAAFNIDSYNGNATLGTYNITNIQFTASPA